MLAASSYTLSSRYWNLCIRYQEIVACIKDVMSKIDYLNTLKGFKWRSDMDYQYFAHRSVTNCRKGIGLGPMEILLRTIHGFRRAQFPAALLRISRILQSEILAALKWKKHP